MKARELRELNEEQLKQKLAELSVESFNHRFTAKTGHLEKPSVIRKTRKAIARIKTILTERIKA